MPLRVDIGPRDVASGATTMSRRTDSAKLPLALADAGAAAATIAAELEGMQAAMLQAAQRRVQEQTFELETYGEMAARLNGALGALPTGFPTASAGLPCRGAPISSPRRRALPGPRVPSIPFLRHAARRAGPQRRLRATSASSWCRGKTTRPTRRASRRRRARRCAATRSRSRCARRGASASSPASPPRTWPSSRAPTDERRYRYRAGVAESDETQWCWRAVLKLYYYCY